MGLIELLRGRCFAGELRLHFPRPAWPRCLLPPSYELDSDGSGNIGPAGDLPAHRLVVILQRPDGRFAVEFDLSGLANAVAVAAGDVNGDAAPDLYVVQGRDHETNAPDRLMLNRGDGARRRASGPQDLGPMPPVLRPTADMSVANAS